MVDVDPLVLVSVAAGVIGLLVFSFLGNSGSKKSRDEEPVRSHSRSSSSHSSHTAAPAPAPVASTPAATTTAAPAAVAAPAAATAAKKKKSKPKKAKTAAKPADNKFDTLATSSANEGEDEADDNDSVASDAIIPSKSAQALLKKSQVEAKAAAEAKAKPEEKKEPEPKKEEKKEEPKAKKPEPKKAAPAAKKEKGGKKATEAKGETKTAEPAAPKAAEKTPEPEESNIDVTPAAVPYDGWAVVERKSKPKSEETAVSGVDTPAPVEETKPEEPEEPAGPVVEIFTEDVVVDAKKLGLLIGPKGVTKIAIQTNSGANITMPKTEKNTTGDVTLTVSGPQEAVKKAVHAINELIAKGYATLISADDFQESYVAVHHKYLPDIIGKGGAVIRALNNHTGVKITVPSEAKTPGPDGRIPKVKIGLAGPKEKVSLTRSLIKELTRCYVTPVTHPGQTYAEVDLDKKYYNYVIGSKGSEIKHIQNSYKVAVHIPDENSVNPNIVIVGTADAVEQTKKHIDKIIERVEAAAAAREAAAAAAGIVIKKAGGENGAANGTAPEANGNGKSAVAAPPGIIQLGGGSGKPGWANGNNKNRVPVAQPSADEEEAWTREFLPPSSAIDIAAILPAGAKYSTSAPIGPAKTVATDANPTPSGLPIEPKQPASGNSAWNNIPGQW